MNEQDFEKKVGEALKKEFSKDSASPEILRSVINNVTLQDNSRYSIRDEESRTSILIKINNIFMNKTTYVGFALAMLVLIIGFSVWVGGGLNKKEEMAQLPNQNQNTGNQIAELPLSEEVADIGDELNSLTQEIGEVEALANEDSSLDSLSTSLASLEKGL